MIKVSAQRKWL